MDQLRQLLASDPRQAEALAREGRRRFPDSHEADERDLIVVAALHNQQRMDRQRIEALYYFEHHPGGRYTKEVILLSGEHPSPPQQNR